MHSREERATKHTDDTGHMEWMHEDIMFRLEDKHKVERAGYPKWHTVTKRSLSHRINEEDCKRSGDWSGISNANPGPHAQTIR